MNYVRKDSSLTYEDIRRLGAAAARWWEEGDKLEKQYKHLEGGVPWGDPKVCRSVHAAHDDLIQVIHEVLKPKPPPAPPKPPSVFVLDARMTEDLNGIFELAKIGMQQEYPADRREVALRWLRDLEISFWASRVNDPNRHPPTAPEKPEPV